MNKGIMNRLERLIQKIKGNNRRNDSLNVPLMNLHNMSYFLYHKRLFDQIRVIDGDIVECGVGHGKSLLSWALLCWDEGKHRKLWGFDSFQGFPEPTEEDRSPREAQHGEWGGTTLPEVLAMLEKSSLPKCWIHAQVTLVKGFFEDSLSKYTGNTIALLYLDADLYTSYKTSLETLYPKVIDGGIIAFDEYMGTKEHYKFPGAKKAIDEFFSGKKMDLRRDEAWGKYYIVKERS